MNERQNATRDTRLDVASRRAGGTRRLVRSLDRFASSLARSLALLAQLLALMNRSVDSVTLSSLQHLRREMVVNLE